MLDLPERRRCASGCEQSKEHPAIHHYGLPAPMRCGEDRLIGSVASGHICCRNIMKIVGRHTKGRGASPAQEAGVYFQSDAVAHRVEKWTRLFADADLRFTITMLSFTEKASDQSQKCNAKEYASGNAVELWNGEGNLLHPARSFPLHGLLKSRIRNRCSQPQTCGPVFRMAP